MVKKILKILLVSLAGVISIAIIIILLAGFGVFNGYLPGFISRQASGSLNGELNISSVKGRLFSHISVNGISIVYKGDTIIRCEKAELNYLLKNLLRKEIRITGLSLTEPYLFLKQEPDSAWNIMNLVKSAGAEDTISTRSAWKFILDDMSVKKLSADILTLANDDMIPDHVGLNLDLSGRSSGDTLAVNIRSFDVKTYVPDFVLADMKGNIIKSGDSFRWSDIELKLGRSSANTQGAYNTANGEADISFTFSPLDFGDFRSFTPAMNIPAAPVINVTFKGDKALYNFSAEISEGSQEIGLTAQLRNPDMNPAYNAILSAANVDLSHWTGKENMKSNISGNIRLDGKGFDLRTNNISIDGHFPGISYGEYRFSDTEISAAKKGSDISGTMRSGTFAGDAYMKFDLSDLFNIATYDVLLDYRNLNLGKIPGIDSIPSALNGDIKIKGSGTDPKKLSVDMEIRSFGSEVMGKRLEDFSLKGSYRRGGYTFSLNGFGAPYFSLDAEGSGNVSKSNNISFSVQALEPGPLFAAFGLNSTDVSGKISGSAAGNIDSMNMTISAGFERIAYDTMAINDLTAEANALMTKGGLSGTLALKTGMIFAGSRKAESINLTGGIAGKTVNADLELRVNDSLEASFSGSVEGFEDPLIRIRHLGIRYGENKWETPGDSATVRMMKSGFSLRNLSLASGIQVISAGGDFSFDGMEDIEFRISDLNLSGVPWDYFLPSSVSGVLSASITLEGTAGEPLIDGNIDADNLEMAGYRIDSIRSRLSYQGRKLALTGAVSSESYGSARLKAELPVMISLKDSTILLKDDTGFSASAVLDSLDLAKVFVLFPVKATSVSGTADAEIIAGNTIAHPVINGRLGIHNGAFANNTYGIRYRNILLSASIDSGIVAIDTIAASSGKGKIGLDGFVSIENTDSLEMNDFQMIIKADNFQLAESNSLELNFDSDINLSGTLGKPSIKGSLDINSSKVNIDYFSAAMSKKTDDPDPPLLIAALKDTIKISAEDTASVGPQFSGTAFYKGLNGEISIDIPGNTWITGKDMNFELEGSLRAIKKTEKISLFGDLNVKRGYYKIYGRSFDFERGKITFTGAGEFNPELDFEISYSFRDIEKELKELKLLVTGRMRQPKLQFTLDEQVLEEKDAISYLVFGKSVNQLGEGEREKISGQEVALGAAMSQLSAVLKNVLQESAGVDVFEVTGGENWKSGSVTIGKYITKNLFLSYDRSFDFDKQSKTAANEKIMLEYQIIRNLILKATNQEINSGFDLIFRMTWK